MTKHNHGVLWLHALLMLFSVGCQVFWPPFWPRFCTTKARHGPWRSSALRCSWWRYSPVSSFCWAQTMMTAPRRTALPSSRTLYRCPVFMPSSFVDARKCVSFYDAFLSPYTSERRSCESAEASHLHTHAPGLCNTHYIYLCYVHVVGLCHTLHLLVLRPCCWFVSYWSMAVLYIVWKHRTGTNFAVQTNQPPLTCA